MEQLQAEGIEKEKIVLAIYAGMAAFSITCLLRLITLPNESILIIIASCFFTISAISYSLIVLSKYHVLLKAKDMHIGHIIVSQDSSEHPRIIGLFCITLGFLVVLLYISVITFIVGIISLVFAVKHHNKFVTEMKKMIGAREALKEDSDS